MRITRTSFEEMETTITFNRHVGTTECATADPAMARRWKLPEAGGQHAGCGGDAVYQLAGFPARSVTRDG